MSINLVTYANQTVTPTNDAIIYERAIDQNGIFHGCNVTVSGNEVHITGGYGIVCGREFVIESEAIPVTLAPSGTNDGRLYVRLDLADADAPIQLLTAQGNPLPSLEQDTDVNYVNGAYEMELATFTVGVSALSDVVETFETIVGVKELLNKAELRTLLWTNPNPTSSFGVTTVPLNLSLYDFIEVEFMDAINAKVSAKRLQPYNVLIASWNAPPSYRNVEIVSSGVKFSEAFDKSSTVNNVLIIPYRIYGITLGEGN